AQAQELLVKKRPSSRNVLSFRAFPRADLVYLGASRHSSLLWRDGKHRVGLAYDGQGTQQGEKDGAHYVWMRHLIGEGRAVDLPSRRKQQVESSAGNRLFGSSRQQDSGTRSYGGRARSGRSNGPHGQDARAAIKAPAVFGSLQRSAAQDSTDGGPVMRLGARARSEIIDHVGGCTDGVEQGRAQRRQRASRF
ncbi:hypothetical protein A4X13_0g9530, partial [Tilletia indica]